MRRYLIKQSMGPNYNWFYPMYNESKFYGTWRYLNIGGRGHFDSMEEAQKAIDDDRDNIRRNEEFNKKYSDIYHTGR